jgi:ribose-phosphate pyrophosphokinase
MKIVCSRFAEHIGKELKKEPYNLDVLFSQNNNDKKRDFPDKEMYIRYDGLEDERTVILTSGQPKPDESIVELMGMVNAVEQTTKDIEIFFLYFPYAMQDKHFKQGEPNMARTIADMFRGYKMHTVDLHFAYGKWYDFYNFNNVSAAPEIINYVCEKKNVDPEDLRIMGPDLGSQTRFNIDGMSKKRINSHDIEQETSEELADKINGHPVLVLDDLIETGGTMCGARKKCFDMGAIAVYAGATSGVLMQGIHRVRNHYKKDLFLTNTVNRHQYSKIDITPLVYKTIA